MIIKIGKIIKIFRITPLSFCRGYRDLAPTNKFIFNIDKIARKCYFLILEVNQLLIQSFKKARCIYGF